MGEQRTLFQEPFDIRGMTFWRGWCEAIVRPVPEGATAPGPKRVDNRPRAPGARLGRWIAIHAGQAIDTEGLAWMRDAFGYAWTAADCTRPGFIIGAARVVGFVDHGERPWYFGPTWKGRANYGWLLDDVCAFEDDPVECKGARGLWVLAPNVESDVRARIETGRRP